MSSTQLVSTITSSSAIKSSATTKLLSTPPVITTIKATTKNTKSKFRPRLNPHELSSKIGQYLSPNLFPRGAIRNPVPPSLAYSRLPPPCAELDPSPTHRIRRFKKWRDVAPELRLVLLDPKRKGHLIRYQTYALPFPNTWTRGVKRRVIPRGVEIRDYAAWPTVESIKTRRAARAKVAATTPILNKAPLGNGNSMKQPVPGPERRKERTRLKQHRWVLHAENERRWRTGMREIMARVTYFQQGCMMEASKWKDGTGVWLPDYDPSEVDDMTRMFRDIRRQPAKVFEMSASIEHVRGRKEAEAAIRDNEAERKNRKEERRAHRAASVKPVGPQLPVAAITAVTLTPVLTNPLNTAIITKTLPALTKLRSRSSPNKAGQTESSADASIIKSLDVSKQELGRPDVMTRAKSSLHKVHSASRIIKSTSSTPTPKSGELTETELLKQLLRHMTKLETRQRRSDTLRAERKDQLGSPDGTLTKKKVISEPLPSLASSASSQYTVITHRVGSLEIDDDTLITPPRTASISGTDTSPISVTFDGTGGDIEMERLKDLLCNISLHDQSDLSSEDIMGESDEYLSLVGQYAGTKDTKVGSALEGDTFHSY